MQNTSKKCERVHPTTPRPTLTAAAAHNLAEPPACKLWSSDLRGENANLLNLSPGVPHLCCQHAQRWKDILNILKREGTTQNIRTCAPSLPSSVTMATMRSVSFTRQLYTLRMAVWPCSRGQRGSSSSSSDGSATVRQLQWHSSESHGTEKSVIVQHPTIHQQATTANRVTVTQ
jgi:hypothetical protein